MAPKSQRTKAEINKVDYVNLIRLFTAKETIDQRKQKKKAICEMGVNIAKP